MTVEQLFCKNCLHTIITSKHKELLSNWKNILLNFFCAPPDFWSQDAGVLPWLASNCLFAFCLTQSSLLHTIFTISLPHFPTNYTNISPQSTSHSSEINQRVAISQTKDFSLRNPPFWGSGAPPSSNWELLVLAGGQRMWGRGRRDGNYLEESNKSTAGLSPERVFLSRKKADWMLQRATGSFTNSIFCRI